MEVTHIDTQIRQSRQLIERLRTLAEREDTETQALLDQALEELSTALEELHVSDEEVRVQNDELAESRLLLERERQRYHDLFELAPDAYLLTDSAGVIQDANSAASALLDFRCRALLGKPLAVFVSASEQHEFRARLLHLAGGTRAEGWELRIHPREGEPRDVVASVQGGPGAVRWLLRDATERKRAEENARRLIREEAAHAEAEAARAHLHRVLLQMPAIVVVTRGRDHVIESVSAEYSRRFGEPGYLGQPGREALPFLEEQGFFRLMDEAFHTGESYIGNEGTVRWKPAPDAPPSEGIFNFVYQPLRDSQGRVYGLLVFAVEVTSLVRARADAEEANRAKSEFLATMSHELRTPINAIVGYTDLMEMGIAGPLTDRQRQQLGRIRVSGEHLTGVVNQILDLAKMEAGRMKVQATSGRLLEAVHSSLTLVKPQAIERGVEVSLRCASDAAASYRGDEERVRQILVNLLGNAVKFTASGGRVTVTCGVEPAPPPEAELPSSTPCAYVRVEDTGVGISPEQLPSVFEPFVQADMGRTRGYEGTGLGLSISLRLARLMDGDLTARSEPGVGSVFTLWLPAEVEAAVQPPLPTSAPATAEPASGFVAVSARLTAEIDAIIAAFVARMREDPEVPHARGASDTELVDHAGSFITDIVQSLPILQEKGGESEMMRDGSDIQRLIAERHGAQRARLGWSEPELRREFRLLREEIETSARRAAPEEAEAAGAILARLVERAEGVSLRGFRLERMEREISP